ncbi:hypothetical protein VHEMI08094 [[Torrubiella] hemipterigena]|uniref:BTB domain-containing protein n=1 Tax=[Torrubiella] hemipterigena TaxID=1531966 RepID=A0A0A1T5J4_9HYPO|nr:hypothetical protein VHEMI08094 [[Torrubiella] hemipterigena]
MVSQPEPHARRRGPSSAIIPRYSSGSSSREKRYNRSHAGGTSSHVLRNEFPIFTQSGDVDIVIRAGPLEKTYLLHKHTLTRCSGFFEASTSDEWSRATTVNPTAATSTTKSKPDAAQTPKRLAAGNELTRVGNASTTDIATSQPTAPPTPPLSATFQPKRWRYELDWGSSEDDIPMLVQKEAQSTPAPLHSSIFGNVPPISRTMQRAHTHSVSLDNSSSARRSSFSRSVANLSLHHAATTGPTAVVAAPEEQDILRDYDNLFRIFYNYPPLLDGINVADAYVQCKRLLSLADQYDALAVVGPRVDHHLLQFQARLWKQVAKYPVSYLRLGYLARSKVIFQEALVHVVGQWPSGERSLRASLPSAVLDLIEDKVDELEETVSRVEGRLFRITLLTSRGERVTPQTSYLDWLVLSLFRQWLADNTTPQPNPSSNRTRSALPSSVPPMSAAGRAYRTIASRPSSAYLNHAVCKDFLKLTPDLYSRDNLRRFEKRLEEVKSMAREIVAPVMGSSLELDILSGGSSRDSGKPSDGIGYLTCTAIRDADLPWSLDD